MTTIRALKSWQDDRNNRIVYEGNIDLTVSINFRGENNILRISPSARIRHLNVIFDCNNASLEIGSHTGVSPLRLYARVGEDCKITLGNNVSTTDKLTITAVEGASVVIGSDVMIAAEVELRTDDAHPIFDVLSGDRVNPSQSIHIGNHVWLAKQSIILGGVSIGDGSVVGFRSLVTKDIPNNCIAAGSPARIIRKDIAWERPHLSGALPFYKPTADTVVKSSYWNLTEDTNTYSI